MGTTIDNIRAGWKVPAFQPTLPRVPGRDEQRNALQALLAFACIHEQASLRNRPNLDEPPGDPQEQFALEEILQLVVYRALSITSADGVAIALAGEDAVVCRASAGGIAPDPGVRLDPASGFSGACLRGAETVRCDDSETDERVNAQACRTLGTRSMVAVPLFAKQQVVGLIEAFSSQPFAFNDGDVRSLNLLGELVSAAVRPEEAGRLAEIARDIGIPGHDGHDIEAPRADRGAATRTPARMLVDEKFMPEPASDENRFEPAAAQRAEHGSSRTPEALPETAVAVGERAENKSSIRARALLVVLLLIATALGWAVWMKIRRAEQAIKASSPAAPYQASAGTPGPQEIIPTTPSEPRPESIPQVTGVRHWSNDSSSTVVVDLEAQVHYEAHSLDNPARVYFDLHGTKLAPGLANQSIEVDDPFLKRVRMAQPFAGVTRIVLELKTEAEFSVTLASNPDRLTIQVHPPGAKGTSAPTGTRLKRSPGLPRVTKKQAASHPPRTSSSGLQIVLDPGHGGWDLGTVGRNGLLEKDLVLDVVRRLGTLLEDKLGAQVIYTRQDDSYLPLEKRAEIANLAKADLFLSVHANYSVLPTARGVETYYTNSYSWSKSRSADSSPAFEAVKWRAVDVRARASGSQRLAAAVQQALYAELAARTPETRNRGVKAAQYAVLTATRMPAVLAEISFVSSPEDENNLQSDAYRQQIAQALYNGVEKFSNASRQGRVKLASAEKLSP